MLQSGNNINNGDKLAVDLCIVGGGVAGIVLALELIDSGLKVALVESGGEHYSQFAQDLNIAESFPQHFPNPHYSRLRFLGGSSNHWENNTSPLSPVDFEQRAGIANSGWPISYSEISPYYSAAQRYCGVDDDGYELEHWARVLKKPVPFENGRLETRVAKAALPPTRFFYQHGAKLVAAENINVITHASLVDLEFDASNQRVKKCEFKSEQGRSFSISADKFCFCMGGIENARFMLAFNQKYNNQLGNQKEKVGRYFMEHPTPRAAQLYTDHFELFEFYQANMLANKIVLGFLSLSDQVVRDEQTINLRMPLIPMDHYTLSDGISSAHILSENIANWEYPDRLPTHLNNVITDIDMLVEAVARKKFDKQLFERAKNVSGFQIPMMMEQTPFEGNRIVLSSHRDALGIPKVNVHYRITHTDRERLWRSLQIVAKEVGINNIGRLKLLRERESRVWADQLGFSNHHMGTTKMADSPDFGVVDPQHKVFGTSNLYIGGSSIFATGGHVPPTLTIAAFSVRLAEIIKHDA